MIDYSKWVVEDFVDNESFLRYVLRDNPQDIDKWELVLKNYPQTQPTAQKAAQILEVLSRAEKPKPDDVALRLKRMHLRLIFAERENRNVLLGIINKCLPYAAIVFLFISVGMGALLLKEAGEPQICRTIVGKGQKSMVVLPDETKVWLNSESELTYYTDFGKKNRAVSIVGEAYFSVKHDSKRPFFVNASEIKIKVYGTEFNVKCYKDEKIVETTLVKGSLSVSQSDSRKGYEMMLKPNQQYVYYRKNAEKSEVISMNGPASQNGNSEERPEMPVKLKSKLIQKIDSHSVTAWREQKLVFNDESFADIAIKLERWYDVKVVIGSDKISKYRFRGTFENETIEQALVALKLATPFNFSIDKRTIYISE